MATVSPLQWSFAKILNGLGLSRLAKAFESIRSKLRANHNKGLKILVTGKSGQGKSSLINGLLGAKVAREGARAVKCTANVETYTKTLSGIPTTVFDSPGLQDCTDNEEEYIQGMREQCQELSLILYCTKMINTRLTNDDKNAMIKLTRAFGENFWDYAVFVLTFANMEDVERRDDRDQDNHETEDLSPELKRQRFKGRVKLWQHELHEFLIKEVGVSAEIAINIPVVPTGDYKKTRRNKHPFHLPDRDNWFGAFWEVCCLRIKETSLFLEINDGRLVPAENDDVKQREDQPLQQKESQENQATALEEQPLSLTTNSEEEAGKQIIPASPSKVMSGKTEVGKPNGSDHLSCMAIPIGYMFVKTIATKFMQEGTFDGMPTELDSIQKMFGDDMLIKRTSSQDMLLSIEEIPPSVSQAPKPSDSLAGLTSRPPSLKELMNEVGAIIPSQWRNIGIQLEFGPDRLSGIEMKYRGDPTLCFAAVFEAWENACNPPFTWNTIIKALESPLVQKLDLAQVIIKNKFFL